MDSFKFSDCYLSKEQAKNISSLSLRTIDYGIARGELQAFKVGRRVLIKKSDLDNWLQQRRIGANLDKIVDEVVGGLGVDT